jgi:hypothetical protein
MNRSMSPSFRQELPKSKRPIRVGLDAHAPMGSHAHGG